MQVSVGVNIGLPSVVISGHYERGYEPQRRTVEYQRERVIYVDNRDYDEDRRYEDRRYVGKKNIMVNGMIKKYKGRKQEECHHDDRYDVVVLDKNIKENLFRFSFLFLSIVCPK
jgi:hypothetical protein